MKPIVRLLCLACCCFFSVEAFAANIEIVEQGDAQKPAVISIEGDLIENDDKTFARIALPIESAVVIMASNGGNLGAGIQIGKAIRFKQFNTLVLKNYPCASACALAWLGGNIRMMEPGGQIGFHAAYRDQNGKIEESGVGNALAGAYLNQLDLPERAVAYITSAAPQSIQWLTLDDARNYGIDVVSFESNSTTKKPEPPLRNMVFKIKDGTDLFGLDLPGMPLTGMTLDLCQNACNSNFACQAFTFNRKSSTYFLKSGADFSVGYEFAIAGYPIEIESKIKQSEIKIHQRTDAIGSDYQSKDDVSLEQCIRECDESSRCRAFTYIAKQRQCWLKSAYSTLANKRGVVSGVK